MSEPNLDNVTKEELYFVLLWMIRQNFSEFPNKGYLCDCGIYAHENAAGLVCEVFDWDDSINQLDTEIDRMEKVLIEQGLTRWI